MLKTQRHNLEVHPYGMFNVYMNYDMKEFPDFKAQVHPIGDVKYHGLPKNWTLDYEYKYDNDAHTIKASEDGNDINNAPWAEQLIEGLKPQFMALLQPLFSADNFVRDIIQLQKIEEETRNSVQNNFRPRLFSQMHIAAVHYQVLQHDIDLAYPHLKRNIPKQREELEYYSDISQEHIVLRRLEDEAQLFKKGIRLFYEHSPNLNIYYPTRYPSQPSGQGQQRL